MSRTRLFLPLVAIPLAIAALAPAALAAYLLPVTLTKWGSTGPSPGQFEYPVGIDCDASGKVYVLDRYACRIQVFTNSGAYLAEFTDRDFTFPMDLAVDGSGDVFVVDGSRNTVSKYTSVGFFITRWGESGTGDGQFNYPNGVDVDAAGNVYVLDAGNHRIQKFTGTGTFLAKWGSAGDGDGELNLPKGIAVSSAGNVYVGDSDLDGFHIVPAKIQEFSSTGTFIRKWVGSGPGSGTTSSQFSDPRWIAIDALDRVYVTDLVRSRVQVFASDGTYLGKWGTPGTGLGQFKAAFGIAVDATGNVFVGDPQLDRIQKFGYTSLYFPPTFEDMTWGKVPGPGDPTMMFHLRWTNNSTEMASQPLSGSLFPQTFGAFLPDLPVPICQFDVPPIPPSSHFDVFASVPLYALPPSAPVMLPGGGPGPADPCTGDWVGNVDAVWSEAGAPAQSSWHGGAVLVAPGLGNSYVHVATGCEPSTAFRWQIVGRNPIGSEPRDLPPGFYAELVQPDRITPAPQLLPPHWSGFLVMHADATVPAGQQIWFDVFFECDDEPARIEVQANTCTWATLDASTPEPTAGFGILATAPNPASRALTVRFATPREGNTDVEIFDAAGRPVRTLLHGVTSAGIHVERWDGRDEHGNNAAPGAYFVRLRSAGRVDRHKVVLVH